MVSPLYNLESGLASDLAVVLVLLELSRVLGPVLHLKYACAFAQPLDHFSNVQTSLKLEGSRSLHHPVCPRAVVDVAVCQHNYPMPVHQATVEFALIFPGYRWTSGNQ